MNKPIPKKLYLPTAWVDEYMPDMQADPSAFLERDSEGLRVSCPEIERLTFPNLSFAVELGDIVELVQIDELGELTLEYNNEFGVIEIDRVPEHAYLFVDGLTDEGGVTLDNLQQIVKDELIGEVDEGDTITARHYIWTEGHRAIVAKQAGDIGAKLELLPFNEHFEKQKAADCAHAAATSLLRTTDHDWCVVLLGRNDPAAPDALPVFATNAKDELSGEIGNRVAADIVEKVYGRSCCANAMRVSVRKQDG